MRNLLILALTLISFNMLRGQSKTLKIGIAGLTHTHVHWLLGREAFEDIEIVGIAEPDKALAARYAKQYGFSMELVYDSLEEMVEATSPEAITAFGTIAAHLEVVEFAAPRGIHVMVEKPLAISLKDAERMASLARKYNIHLLTNYETTWYATHHELKSRLDAGEIGALRKVVIRDGHRGPKKIGVNKEFLEWLTHPEYNGAGALMDFGCYGANLMTWLMEGQRPLSVTAVTQQLQPENNPLVDDEAMIILTYPKANALIQASWNWPIGRKDMEVYGLKGVLYADNGKDLRKRIAEGYDGYQEEQFSVKERAYPVNDPFAYLVAVVRGEINRAPTDLSALENNLLVMEILEAAMKSARTGETVHLPE
ncbi:Gfo/Idh/MocA family oxidoreductase [Robertkochia marina]|uniref:Gfo/Idh/MocA family oxidoreductase n=1 Tax=Robertkochia marina TaxID=1227945 RepID=A0A4S3LYZ3_9FLAO|nr:Gfo/Idh/MocA family oxidoreductase [Robertkochia marina]THD66505.1 Gfo/Idh/MocA family oxidoreductase [Robertkochia marina]TRZ45656.1 gfo/Idh/MocA family oxidoreductase [Robertkochia marina]